MLTPQTYMCIEEQSQFMNYPDLLISTHFMLEESTVLLDEQQSESLSSDSWASASTTLGVEDFEDVIDSV